MSVLHLVRRSQLIASFAIFLSVSVACGDERQSQTRPLSLPAAAVSTETAEALLPNQPDQGEDSNPETPADQTSPKTALVTAPGTAVANSQIADVVPCGIVLPIVAEDNASPVSSLAGQNLDLAAVPTAARQAVERIIRAPQSIGLVAFEIGYESEGAYMNADIPMPIASLVKVVNLIAYAEAVERGDLDPSEWIPIAEIERAYLPGSDLGAHRVAISELEENNLVSEGDRATPLEQIPWMMIRHSSNAASDYLHMAVGQRVIEETAVRMNLQSHTAPCPFVGQFLAMSNSTRSESDRVAVDSYINDPGYYGSEVMRLTDEYMNDVEFRESEGYWRASISVQRGFADELNAKASPRDYSQLMARIIQNDIGSDYVNILVRRVLEWPMIYPANQQLFSTIGYKNGSLPGVLTTLYYGQRIEDGKQVVVALFYRDLPMQTYRRWRENLTHDELARWILTDPEAIPLLRSWFEPAP
jgi:hypothetical protein